MTKRILSSLAVLGLVLVLAAPLAAQTTRLVANIPFEFVAGRTTLPAGGYELDGGIIRGVVRIWSDEATTSWLVLSHPLAAPLGGVRLSPRLVFHRYGNQYFLSEIWSGFGSSGRMIPPGNVERALSESAAFRTPEKVVVLLARL
jgi:hypothetical protein